jgi:hypothetical protein
MPGVPGATGFGAPPSLGGAVPGMPPIPGMAALPGGYPPPPFGVPRKCSLC